MVLKPGGEKEAERIFRKWELDFAVIGKLTNSGRLVCKRTGKTEVDIPVGPLVEQSPVYNRPWEPTPAKPVIDAKKYPLPKGDTLLTVLQKLMQSPDLCSRRWIWQQYDSLIGADTAIGPGGDAAVIRVRDTNKALAMVVDCSPRYCAADPVMGGKQAVAETWRNLCAVGAKPLAITDNMNFGNPEKPNIMGQFVGAVEGIKEACLALDYPVVSGNCSLYNETDGQAIMPAPVIGGVGLLDDVTKAVTIGFKAEDETIFVIGETKTHIGQSLYLREIFGKEEGAPPPIDLKAERKNGEFIRALINDRAITACHDVADGGLLVALAEMALAGDIGCALEDAVGDAGFWYGEDQARYVVAANRPELFEEKARAAGVPYMKIGTTGGNSLSLKVNTAPLPLSVLKVLHESWLPDYMAS